MSLTTYSKFYYGHIVTADNNKINFNEGGSELTATLNTGSYTLSEYVTEIKRALDAAGALTYTVSVVRSTRIITVAAGSNFALLTTSGTQIDSGAFDMMGFSGADKTGASTYSASVASGSSYSPQFLLQDYISNDDLRKSVDASISETASGRVEIVRFGVSQFFEMNIRFITDITQPSIGPIRTNSSGRANARTFMQYLINKTPVEFMPDENTPDTYHKVILESSPEDPKGAGYRLKPRYDIGLPGYFDSGLLKFRVVD